MFSGLDKQELGEIIRLTRSVEFQAGQTICRQHEPGDSMFIIATGRAEVQIAKEPGQFIPVAKLGPGELIGELALIDAQPRSAQVVRNPCEADAKQFRPAQINSGQLRSTQVMRNPCERNANPMRIRRAH